MTAQLRNRSFSAAVLPATTGTDSDRVIGCRLHSLSGSPTSGIITQATGGGVVDPISGKIVPQTCWEKAVDELTDKQRKTLETFRIGNIKTFEAEIKTLRSLKDGCTNNLSPGPTDKKPIMTRVRIHNILKKMEKYAIIGDIAIQQNPNIVALVWAGVRFCLQVRKIFPHLFSCLFLTISR